MSLVVREESIAAIAEHAGIPVAFLVERRFVVSASRDVPGAFELTEQPVDPPWVKDYDAIKGEGPTRWLRRFDTANWGLIAAYEGGVRIGGAVVAFNTGGVDMLEGRSDLAVIWDIRVRPNSRSRGIGGAIFEAIEQWARDRGCTTLKAETQDINVPACRFYLSRGCTLAAIDPSAYPDLPEETELLWFKVL